MTASFVNPRMSSLSKYDILFCLLLICQLACVNGIDEIQCRNCCSEAASRDLISIVNDCFGSGSKGCKNTNGNVKNCDAADINCIAGISFRNDLNILLRDGNIYSCVLEDGVGPNGTLLLATNVPTSSPTIPTTSSPTTSNPTTSRPTTSSPTTSSPTTSNPTTSSPTTSIPTSSNPTTSSPTTSSPTTSSPTTSKPTSSSPTTSSPTTSNPSTSSPTVSDASTLDPTSSPTTSTATTFSPTIANPTTTDPTSSPTSSPTTTSPTTSRPTSLTPTSANNTVGKNDPLIGGDDSDPPSLGILVAFIVFGVAAGTGGALLFVITKRRAQQSIHKQSLGQLSTTSSNSNQFFDISENDCGLSNFVTYEGVILGPIDLELKKRGAVYEDRLGNKRHAQIRTKRNHKVQSDVDEYYSSDGEADSDLESAFRPSDDYYERKNSKEAMEQFNARPSSNYLRRIEKEKDGSHVSIFRPSTIFLSKHRRNKREVNRESQPRRSSRYIKREGSKASILRPSSMFLSKHRKKSSPRKKSSGVLRIDPRVDARLTYDDF